MGISTAETKPELTKYELLDQIGHGGMATVYRARDRRLGRDVAVKVIHPHLRGSAEVAARFVSEARAVAMLKHENIVEVYDISDEAEDERYLVVELVTGPTLRRLLTERGALPPEVAAAIALQIAAALQHAHEQNIIHRDVKPENVLIAPPRTGGSARDERAHTVVKLTDFGIAKLLDAHGITSTGQVLGSPAHMAPEQIEGGDVGARADVFGLGVLFYECMVGRLPFDGKNPAQVLRRVLEGEHPPADRERPQVGQQWSRILDKALMKDQAERFESIDAFSKAIRDELDRLGIDDPDGELDRFIADAEGYLSRYSDFIVARLIHAGEDARRSGEILVASSEFNRALALRPGDRELVRRVSALARRSQLQRLAKVGGGIVVAAGAVTAVALAVSKRSHTGNADAETAPSAHRSLAVISASPAKKHAIPVAPSGSSANAEAEDTVTHMPVRHAPRPPASQEAALFPDRPVTVNVNGPAKGGIVVIDNVEQPNWYGAQYPLKTGQPHTFGFRFANPDCCTATPVTKTIDPGEGPVKIELTTSFRDATLDVQGPEGLLSCPALLTEPLQVPGHTLVRVSHWETPGHCNFKPEDPNSHRSGEVRFTLTAGNTTTIRVP